MRRLVYLFGGAAAAGAASYLVIYLYRWQWQRAILCGVLLLVVEVLLFGLAVLGRISRLEARIDKSLASDRRREAVLARLRLEAPPGGTAWTESGGGSWGTDGLGPPPGGISRTGPGGGGWGVAGAARARFRWLEDPADPGLNRTHVFVPVLMVTGVLLSGLAWVVQKVAESTVRPAADRRLAGRLAPLAAPPMGALDGGGAGRAGGGRGADGPDGPDGPDLEDLPPLGRGRSPWSVGAIALTAVALLTAGVVGIADLTQTREERASDAAATSVLVKVVLRDESASSDRADFAAHQIWEHCRGSTSVPLRHATLGELGDGMYAGAIHPALTPHDTMRLRGCLEDTAVDRAHFQIVGIGEMDPDDG
ncbi:hypothetical protein ACQUSR_22325 [Streptomyces sp. P1-3]|uniref:hypothetical protein n=1 Tax=Streptomyces sp. P1-3 TaxID=3421658 RepID=UPI003D367944